MSQNSNTSYLNFLQKVGISSFLQDKPRIFYNILDNNENNNIDKNIAEITKLSDLDYLIKKTFASKFKKYSNKIIVGYGNEKADIYIIGDFAEENKNEIKPFGADSYKLLNKMLIAINLEIKSVYTTNIIPWPNYKGKGINNENILETLPFIQRQIEIIKPKIILLMGSLAYKVILNSNLEINKIRGRWHNYKSINLKKSIDCLVTYHPRHLILSPEEKKYAWEDLKMLQKKVQNND